MRSKNINTRDKILLETLVDKYGNKNVTHVIKKLNESNNSNDPVVYVGTYAKYDSGSL
jgi:methionine synthase I (cobalamin-dependent)